MCSKGCMKGGKEENRQEWRQVEEGGLNHIFYVWTINMISFKGLCYIWKGPRKTVFSTLL